MCNFERLLSQTRHCRYVISLTKVKYFPTLQSRYNEFITVHLNFLISNILVIWCVSVSVVIDSSALLGWQETKHPSLIREIYIMCTHISCPTSHPNIWWNHIQVGNCHNSCCQSTSWHFPWDKRRGQICVPPSPFQILPRISGELRDLLVIHH